MSDRLAILLQPTLGIDGIGLDGTFSTIGLGAGAQYFLGSVSDNVALDLGGRLLVQAPDGGELFISLPVGYIGVRGFIP